MAIHEGRTPYRPYGECFVSEVAEGETLDFVLRRADGGHVPREGGRRNPVVI